MSYWRVVELETHDAYMNMALDEAVCEAIAAREAGPTIRFYRWAPSAVSIGYFQSLNDEVAVDKCNASGIDVVRRRTGGGAVFHDYEGEITYSVIAPEIYFPKGIIDSYKIICGWIMDSLRRIGVQTEFKPINDIIMAQGAIGPDGRSVAGKKISGNAQTRRNGVLLQHGTILCQVDVPKMFSLLKVGQEKIADKMIAAVEERVTSIEHLSPNLKMEEIYAALHEGFTQGKRWSAGDWTLAELTRAQELVTERYNRDRWNAMR